MMRVNKLVWASAAMLAAAALTSCNLGKAPAPTPDVNAIYTSAAQTMVADLSAQQTQTAAAIPPTPVASPTLAASFTPLATFPIGTGAIPFGTPFALGTPFTLGTPRTPLATLPSGTGVYSMPVGCSDATYIGETAPYDKTVMTPGERFTKGWSLLNSGTCKWDGGFSFAFKSGDQMQGQDVLITDADTTLPGHSQAFVIHMQAPRAAGEYKGFWQMKNDAGQWFGSLVFVDIVIGTGPTPTPTK
ncbi:MAG TPA: NBR1-Ig-like domain-containing protein [Anaerolineales bacterium]